MIESHETGSVELRSQKHACPLECGGKRQRHAAFGGFSCGRTRCRPSHARPQGGVAARDSLCHRTPRLRLCAFENHPNCIRPPTTRRHVSGSAGTPPAVFRASRNTHGHPRRSENKLMPDVPREGARHCARGARAPPRHAIRLIVRLVNSKSGGHGVASGLRRTAENFAAMAVSTSRKITAAITSQRHSFCFCSAAVARA